MRSLRSFYVKQPCIAYSSVMLPSNSKHGLAVTCGFSARSSVGAHGFKRAVTPLKPILTRHTPGDFFDVDLLLVMFMPKDIA